MTYRILPSHLHGLAETAKSFCSLRWGVSARRIAEEQPIQPDIQFVTTLSVATSDHYHLCIEVSTRAYPSALDSFVLDCKNRGLPVRLYTAISKNQVEGDFRGDLSKARASGVGIIEFSESVGTILTDALPLSLSGLRPLEPALFPARFRQPIAEADRVFRNGNPSKGCSLIYDEIEDLSRRLAEKCYKNGWWRPYKGDIKPQALRANSPWAKIARILQDHLDKSQCKCPGLTQTLLARILAVTEYRNDSGHKPRNARTRERRDRELRTRFEGACDLLHDLTQAVKPLRL